MIVAGIGCRKGCPADAIVAILREAEARAGCSAAMLAIPHFKAGEPGVTEAASRLGLTLTVVDADAMAAMQAFCVTRSEAAMFHTGLASVAEAAALAAAGPSATLRLPRIATAGVTCAIVEGFQP